VEAAKLELGQAVAVDLRGSSIVLTPTHDNGKRLPSLAELLDGVTPDKVGGEYNWGVDQGREKKVDG